MAASFALGVAEASRMIDSVINAIFKSTSRQTFNTIILAVLFGIPFLTLAIGVVRKNMNPFTSVYCSLNSNIMEMLFQIACLFAFYILCYEPLTQWLPPLLDEWRLPGLFPVLCVMFPFLIWTAIDSRVFRYDGKAVRRHRISSWTILYFLERYYGTFTKNEWARDTYKIASPDEAIKKRMEYISKVDAPESSPYDVLFAGMKQKDEKNLSKIKLNEEFAYLLRYHELFGRVPYVDFLSRVLIAPVISLIVAAILSGLFTVVLAERAEILNEFYQFIAELSATFGGLNALLFGPAFIPLQPEWALSEGGRQITLIVVLSRLLFPSIFILVWARGGGTGTALCVAMASYTLFFAFFIHRFSIPYSGTYFDVIANQIESVRPSNRWLRWMYDYSGFTQLTGELRRITDEQFILLATPGFLFWLISTIIVIVTVYRTPAGRVTYRNELVLPFISRGQALGLDDPILLRLRGRTPSFPDNPKQATDWKSVNPIRLETMQFPPIRRRDPSLDDERKAILNLLSRRISALQTQQNAAE